ncbi:MAG: DUF1800 domain-containing protein [Paracoccaceae bacterium]
MKSLDAFIALNRFGLGPAPDEAAQVEPDPRAWIASQIGPQPLPPALAGLDGSEPVLAALYRALASGDRDARQAARLANRKAFPGAIMARTRAMIASPAPFAERMVLFWSNHFTVSALKANLGPAVPAYEREAIRPHVFGRFADMLRAVARHPVMLIYLDNTASVGENSRAGQRVRANKGKDKTINENLAREILELHTLGVHGGYDQQDVIELARALTGWTHGGLRRRDPETIHGGFEFRPNVHEPGPKTLLGKTYPEDGANEGLAILDDLARHPATARHIATKLARHFIADDPPDQAVDTLAKVFLDTEGDLAALSRALIDLPQVWAAPLPKVKTHYELAVATHRATGQTPRAREVIQPLREFGQLPFTAPSPAGWGDRAEDWIAPEALMRRIEWLRRFAGTLPATLYPDELMEQALGPALADDTRLWVERAPSGDAALAMILASPEFQRR